MTILKCKMCGGDLELTEGSRIAQCEYCGAKQTVPEAVDDKKANLFNRANRLRMHSEFDKAADIYEMIVAEFPEEAEAYWGLCLCNYGIEYVDDPATEKKIPTCHRASFSSLQKDENFRYALEYADVSAQKVYRDEAREIDRIMGEILSVSKNEKPYDVFICYKETDENGQRTEDSVIAYDIYEALVAKGLNVFFARVTLEDKLGVQYEPYIFAALNSAKVMLCIGTKYEYFHAVWVKNEWARFLKLMAKDKEKVLVPCFKDLDAYDMPDQFKGLQAQDLGKLGAMQDLVRGVMKIVSFEKEPVSQPAKVAPCLINNVATIGDVDGTDMWPKGTYSNKLNVNRFRYVRFILSLPADKLSSYTVLNIKFDIYNESNNQVLDKVSTLDWGPDYDKASLAWRIRGTEGDPVPTGKYRAEFRIGDSQSFIYHFEIVASEEVVKSKPVEAPCLISNVSTIGGVDNDDMWPKGTYNIPVNLDKFRYVRFIMSMPKEKLTRYSVLNIKFEVFNAENYQMLDTVSKIDWAPNYDKVSLAWCIRGTDGTIVPTGKYRAVFSVDGSRSYSCNFEVTSNEEIRRAQQQSNPQAYQDQQLMLQRRQRNLCVYCGGVFKGLFTKRCCACGRLKNY